MKWTDELFSLQDSDCGGIWWIKSEGKKFGDEGGRLLLLSAYPSTPTPHSCFRYDSLLGQGKRR